MKLLNIIAAITCIGLLSSCNQYVKTSMGGSTDVVLNRNSDEYNIKRLKPIDMDGYALFGIPGFGVNNKNKNKSGMVFKLNGLEIGRTPRIFPIITMLAASYGSAVLLQSVIKDNNIKPIISTDPFAPVSYGSRNFFIQNDLYANGGLFGANYGQLRFGWAYLLGLPIAGAFNNWVWSGSSASGLTNQMYYRLVDENPDVDIFTNPKYKIDYKLRVFDQKAKIHADVMGATLKLKQ